MLKEKSTYEIMSPETIGLKESKLVMGKHSGRHAFREKLIDLGYENLTEDQVNAAFGKFKDLADRKKTVSDEDIRALLEEKLVETPEIFALEHLVVSFDSHAVPSARVRLKTAQGIVEGSSEGNGSVDAIYQAIDALTGETVELDDYTIKSVTDGADALGEVHVLLKQGDVSAQGRGVSTDILEASARAYVDALNRLVDKRNAPARSRRDNVTLI
jgi:2-isopropylmalate synthase